MIRTALAAAALLAPFCLGAPAAAQSQQEALDARYDRALAAGYKALFLCSAIANAERNGATRTPESIERWELSGIQAPLDEIVGGLSYRIIRNGGYLHHVEVDWSNYLPPRAAEASWRGGCSLAPIGRTPSLPETLIGVVQDESEREAKADKFDGLHLKVVQQSGPPINTDGPFDAGFERAFGRGHGEGTRTTSVIVQQGDSSWERYAAGFDENTPQRTWSVAKSIAATLVGASVGRGEVKASQRAGLESWRDDARRAITIDHLLRMASGRYTDTPGNSTDPLYFGGSTVAETAAHWPLIHPPGTVFRYANNDTLMAVEAISETFGAHSPAEFFAKLGMDHTVAETDWQGDYILSSQVWSTARDLARLGQLYLDDGILPNGERILPEGWREYVSSPSGPQPEGPFGYGAGFWLFNKSDGVPPDTFAAMGNRGQFIVIVPSRNVVIVRRGEDPVGSRFDIAAFTRDVLAALGD